MLYNKLLAIRWIRLRVMSDDSDRKALMSNPDITRNLNAAEVEFALQESPGRAPFPSEKESCRTKNIIGGEKVSQLSRIRRSMNFIIRFLSKIIFHLSLLFSHASLSSLESNCNANCVQLIKKSRWGTRIYLEYI